MATDKTRRPRYPVALEEGERRKLRKLAIDHGWSAEGLGAWFVVHGMEQVDKGRLKVPKPPEKEGA